MEFEKGVSWVERAGEKLGLGAGIFVFVLIATSEEQSENLFPFRPSAVRTKGLIFHNLLRKRPQNLLVGSTPFIIIFI